MTRPYPTPRLLSPDGRRRLIRQAAVVGLSLFPLGVSILAAYVAWNIVGSVEAWRMVTTVLVWVAAFAAGTQLFWKAVGVLAPKQ